MTSCGVSTGATSLKNRLKNGTDAGLLDSKCPSHYHSPPEVMDTQTLPDNILTTQLKKVVNWARRSSLWPMPFATACCGIELMATASSRYDLARFGAEAMRFSPRQSDLMIVAGRVTIKMMPVLQHIYQQMTEPKWVISMGACASTGGVFDAYATIQRIIDQDGLPPSGPRRPLQVAVEPSYVPAPQPVVGTPLTVGGRPI